MEMTEFLSFVNNADELIKRVQQEKAVSTTDIKNYLKQYNTKDHDINSTTLRPDKIVENNGVVSTVKVARLTVPIQKQIVMLAAAFLCGNPIEIMASEENETQKELMKVIRKTWKQNKLDYDSKTIASILMSETEVAELWYSETAPAGYWKGTKNDNSKVTSRLRVKILANSYGDELYPVFNNSGDMIAFGRAYTLKVSGENEEHFDLYTDENVYKHVKRAGNWVQTVEAHLLKKIPVIYYSQALPEWYEVQPLIDRFEKLISNHADTNDYFGSPILFAEGEIEGFSKKGESGKVFVGKGGAKMQYLTWDQSPESVKLEYNNLRSLIHDMTNTPDISIEQMKSLGTYSGIALKMLFLGAHLKAANKEENFGKGIQRRLNFIKESMVLINPALEAAATMEIEPKFEFYLPKNVEETISMLTMATNNQAILSQETAVSLNPLVKNSEVEYEKIKNTAPELEPV